MPFKVRKVSSYEWPVKVDVPEKGRFKEETFTAVFRKISRSQFNSLIDDGDEVLVDHILMGWKGIVDDDGDEIEFCDDIKAALVDDPHFLRGLISAFSESLVGAQAKN
tara:strand:- start:257 stop:580 length:324 start_codon:yes stop_codon:yes gene_type:complete